MNKVLNEPVLLGLQHAQTVHQKTRSLWSVSMLLLAALLMAVSPLVPGAAGLLSVRLEDTIPVAILFASAMLAATAAYHRWGWSRAYFIWNDIETVASVSTCLYLVYASGSTVSIFWIFFLITGFFAASTSTFWSRPHEVFLFAGVAVMLVVAFAFKGMFADAALSLLFGFTGLWLVAMLSSTSRQLQSALVRQAELQSRYQELLIKQERARIARDLHDGLGTDMTSLLWQVRTLQTEARGTEWGNRLQPLIDRLCAGVDELRGVVWAMRAQPRTWPELVSELSERCAGLCRQAAFTVQSSGGTADQVIAGDVAGAVVRIALEAVRNADRHATARAITLGISITGDVLRVEVSDDGHGIPEAELAHSRGGLRNLRDRAAELDGTLEIVSGHPGTHVVFTVRLSSGRAPQASEPPRPHDHGDVAPHEAP